MFCTHKLSNCAVTDPLFNYKFQKLSLLHWQDYKCEWRRYFCYFFVIFSFFTDILIKRVLVGMGLKQGMCFSLVLADRSGSRGLTKSYWLLWWLWLWKSKSVWYNDNDNNNNNSNNNNNNNIKCNEALMLVILNCILLHNQKMDGLCLTRILGLIVRIFKSVI
jgi:hypothetical protein